MHLILRLKQYWWQHNDFIYPILRVIVVNLISIAKAKFFDTTVI